MNVLTKIRAINDLNNKELRLGIVNTKASWHTQYQNSAWIYVGSIPYEITEGDVLCVFSQYGEIVNINMIRDKKTGKSKGFAFICYQDQRSTILAVDNLNGAKIRGRQLLVDHVESYKVPKDDEKNVDDLTTRIREHGVAPSVMHMYQPEEKDSDDDVEEVEITEQILPLDVKQEPLSDDKEQKHPKKKKKKKKAKKEKSSKKSKKRKSESSDSSDSDQPGPSHRRERSKRNEESPPPRKQARNEENRTKVRGKSDKNHNKKRHDTSSGSDDNGRISITEMRREPDRDSRRKPNTESRKNRETDFIKERDTESKSHHKKRHDTSSSSEERVTHTKRDRHANSRRERNVDSRSECDNHSRRERDTDSRRDRNNDSKKDRYTNSRRDRDNDSRRDRDNDSRRDRDIDSRKEKRHRH